MDVYGYIEQAPVMGENQPTNVIIMPKVTWFFSTLLG
jgi:hypothetical protein